MKRVELHDRLMTREPEPTDALLHRFSPTHLGASSGLRVGELLGLKWEDVSFESLEVNVVRAVVKQKITRCKTEASRKPIPGRRVGKGSVELEASISISADPRLGVCKSCQPWAAPVFVHGHTSGTCTRLRSGGNWACDHSRISAHLPVLARRCADSAFRAAKDDATHGHPYHNEYLRRCGYGRDEYGEQQGRRACVSRKRSASRAQILLNH